MNNSDFKGLMENIGRPFPEMVKGSFKIMSKFAKFEHKQFDKSNHFTTYYTTCIFVLLCNTFHKMYVINMTTVLGVFVL